MDAMVYSTWMPTFINEAKMEEYHVSQSWEGLHVTMTGKIHETWTLHTKEHPVFDSIRSNSTNQKLANTIPSGSKVDQYNESVGKMQLFAVIDLQGSIDLQKISRTTKGLQSVRQNLTKFTLRRVESCGLFWRPRLSKINMMPTMPCNYNAIQLDDNWHYHQ